MPNKDYEVTDNETGKKYILSGDHAPTEDEIHQALGEYHSAKPGAPPKPYAPTDDALVSQAKGSIEEAHPKGFFSHVLDVAQEAIPDTSTLINDTGKLFGRKDDLVPEVGVTNLLKGIEHGGRALADRVANTGEEELGGIGGVLGGLVENTAKTAQGATSPVGLLATLAGAGAESPAVGQGLKALLGATGKAASLGFGAQGAGDVYHGATDENLSPEERAQRIAQGIAMVAGTGAHLAEGTKIGTAPIQDVPRMAAAPVVRGIGRAIESGIPQHIAGYGLGYEAGKMAGFHPFLTGIALHNTLSSVIPKELGTRIRAYGEQLGKAREVPVEPVKAAEQAAPDDVIQVEPILDEAKPAENVVPQETAPVEQNVVPATESSIPAAEPLKTKQTPYLEFDEKTKAPSLKNSDALSDPQKAEVDQAFSDYTTRINKSRSPEGIQKAQKILNMRMKGIIEGGIEDNVVPSTLPLDDNVSAVTVNKGAGSRLSQPLDPNHPLDQVEAVVGKHYMQGRPEQMQSDLEALQAQHEAEHNIPVVVNKSKLASAGWSDADSQYMASRVHAMLAEQAKVNPALVKHMQDEGYIVHITPEKYTFKHNGIDVDAAGVVNYDNKTLTLSPELGMWNVYHAVGLHELGHIAVEAILKRMADLGGQETAGLQHFARTKDRSIWDSANRQLQPLRADIGTLGDIRSTVVPTVSPYSQGYINNRGSHVVSSGGGSAGITQLGNERFADLYSAKGPHRAPAVDLTEGLKSPLAEQAFRRLLLVLGVR